MSAEAVHVFMARMRDFWRVAVKRLLDLAELGLGMPPNTPERAPKPPRLCVECGGRAPRLKGGR